MSFFMKLEAGGKPSTWLPPERLVEHMILYMIYYMHMPSDVRASTYKKIPTAHTCKQIQINTFLSVASFITNVETLEDVYFFLIKIINFEKIEVPKIPLNPWVTKKKAKICKTGT